MSKPTNAVFAILACVSFTSSSGCSLRAYDPGVFDHRLRRAVFDRYWSVLDAHYPFFELAGVDWRALRREYRQELINVDSRSAFYHGLSAMLARLNDGHVDLRITLDHFAGPTIGSSEIALGLCLIERRCYVAQWPRGSAPHRPQSVAAQPYAYPELVAIAGQPFTIQFADELLAGRAGSTVNLRLRWPDGTEANHTLIRPPARSNQQSTAPQAAAKPKPEFEGNEWLDVQRAGDIGYVRLRTLNPDKVENLDRREMVLQFDAAVARLQDTTGIILDLQCNSGGDVSVTKQIAGKFLEGSTLFGRFHHRLWGIVPISGEHIIESRDPVYTGRLVVLISSYSASAAEHLAWVLQRQGRATLVGERTFGAEAGTTMIPGPDGTLLKFGKYRITDSQGRGFQGKGIEPDVEVALTLESVLARGYESATRQIMLQRLDHATALISGSGRKYTFKQPYWDGLIRTALAD